MKLHQFLKLFQPARDLTTLTEKALSGAAAFGAIGAVIIVSRYFVDAETVPWIIASMGSSAVLLFAQPAGPSSQPWPFVGGHLISGLIGITALKLIIDPVLSASIAVGLSVFVMYITRSLHPPAGATTLTVVVGSDQLHQLGYMYLLTPLALNIAIMLAWALFINNLLPNRSYPSLLMKFLRGKDEDKNKTFRAMTIRDEDLRYAMREIGEFIDVSEEDLSRIFKISATHARRRRMGEILCGEIMTRDIASVDYDTQLEEVWKIMARHQIRGVPVVDRKHRVIGIVTLKDFLNQVNDDATKPLKQRLLEFIRPTSELETSKKEYAGHVMTAPVMTISETQHILDIFPIFYELGIQHLPVVDENMRLVGMITPKNVLQALHADQIQHLQNAH